MGHKRGGKNGVLLKIFPRNNTHVCYAHLTILVVLNSMAITILKAFHQKMRLFFYITKWLKIIPNCQKSENNTNYLKYTHKLNVNNLF